MLLLRPSLLLRGAPSLLEHASRPVAVGSSRTMLAVRRAHGLSLLSTHTTLHVHAHVHVHVVHVHVHAHVGIAEPRRRRSRPGNGNKRQKPTAAASSRSYPRSRSSSPCGAPGPPRGVIRAPPPATAPPPQQQQQPPPQRARQPQLHFLLNFCLFTNHTLAGAFGMAIM